MRKRNQIPAILVAYKALLVCILAIVLALPVAAASGEKIAPVKGTMAIFARPQKVRQMKALAERTISFIKELFDKGGRFIPVENHRLMKVYNELATNKDINEKDLPKEIASRLDVALYVVVNINYQGGFLYARMDFVPLQKHLAHLKKRVIIRSKIHLNIPFKLGREVAIWHQDQQLPVTVEKKQGAYYVISAGQWHGVKPGSYITRSGETIRIIETSRYRSLAELPEDLVAKKAFIIDQYPDVDYLNKRIDSEIAYNIHKRYALENSLLQGQSPEKRLLEGLCIVNPGANICLPVYGSFLATGYMGFDPKSPDFGGMAVPLGIVALQFNATEMMTRYRSHFFPWIKDSDKDERTQRLQIFLWATLPLTFSATYMDQLTRQYARTKHLPPYFGTKDVSSLLFSLFIPGGGLFYKGHRVMGWSYYTAELALASYGMYYLGKGKRSLYAFSILGVLKLIEFFHAYIIKPAFDFYNIETDGDYYRTGFTVSFNVVEENRPVYTCAANFRY